MLIIHIRLIIYHIIIILFRDFINLEDENNLSKLTFLSLFKI